MKPVVSIMWFRRDLRLHDNAALFHALQYASEKNGAPVLPIFIFDKQILDKLEDKSDKRVVFIEAALQKMHAQLQALGSGLTVLYSTPHEAFKKLLTQYTVAQVFTNHDYEPYALERDTTIEQLLASQKIGFSTYKDQVVFEKFEVVKDDGKPYTVFTPYSRKWKAYLAMNPVTLFDTKKVSKNYFHYTAEPMPTLASMGFTGSAATSFPGSVLDVNIVKKYTDNRNFPAIENSTSKMGVHLRFGTVSVREILLQALPLNETYVNEIIWRDFYHAILFHFPKVGKGESFKKEYDFIKWRNNEKEFEYWCNGTTGYPIVDAGMRELNATGFMHNRVRMITASFLCKHLLIDWRWGEAYFAQKLLDFDLASNNGGWQWASSSGCDAAPYFRVFNPTLQTEKFDKNLVYIKKWIPELGGFEYPNPIVVHEVARKRVLETYAEALKSK